MKYGTQLANTLPNDIRRGYPCQSAHASVLGRIKFLTKIKVWDTYGTIFYKVILQLFKAKFAFLS